MSVLEQVALAWQAALRTAAMLARPGTWWPWIVLGGVHVLAIALVVNFAHPALSPWMAPLVRALAGEAALHYPELYGALPGILSTLGLAIGAVPGAVAAGAATRIFAERFQGRSADPLAALGEAGRRWASLVAAQLPLHLLTAGFALGLGGWLDSRNRSLVVRALGILGTTCGGLIVQALLFYVAALVMLEGRSALRALGRVPATWAGGFWAALAVGSAVLAARLSFQLLLDRAAAIAERGRPELVAAIALGQAGFTLLLGYLIAGSATLVYLASPAPAAEDEA